MDDLEFRRRIVADPFANDPELQAAAQTDAKRLQWLKDAQQLSAQLSSALDIPVPDNLAQRLILRQSLADHQQQRRRWWRGGIASSVVLLAGLISYQLHFKYYGDVGLYALNHVRHELDLFDATPQLPSLATINSKLARFGARLDGLNEQAQFAMDCNFAGIDSLHMVLKGDMGPVSVFVVPSQLGKASQFADERFVGTSLSLAAGQLILVGEKGENLTKVGHNLFNHLVWKTS